MNTYNDWLTQFIRYMPDHTFDHIYTDLHQKFIWTHIRNDIPEIISQLYTTARL